MSDDDFYPIENVCPHCGGYCADDEVIDGTSLRCASCGKWVMAVAYTDKVFRLIDNEPKLSRLTGRKKTRAQWRRMGRR